MELKYMVNVANKRYAKLQQQAPWAVFQTNREAWVTTIVGAELVGIALKGLKFSASQKVSGQQ